MPINLRKRENMIYLENLLRSNSLISRGVLSLGLAVNQSLTILVHVEFSNHDVRGVESNGDGRSVGLFASDLFQVDDPTASVHSLNFAFTTLEASAHDHDFITLANRKRANVVGIAELFAEGGAHDHTALTGGSGKVALA